MGPAAVQQQSRVDGAVKDSKGFKIGRRQELESAGPPGGLCLVLLFAG